MRFYVLLVLLGLFGIGGAPARAEINIMDSLGYTVNIAVQNNTPSDVTFLRMAAVCSTNAPTTFIAKASSKTMVSLYLTYKDKGTDNCFAKPHTILYMAQQNPLDMILIAQHVSNDPACLSIKKYAVLWVTLAVCPAATGRIVTAGPDKNGVLYCPPTTPSCPPGDNGAEQFFGFAINPSPTARAKS